MILHIDMDAFYASIEQRDHPELRGKPVAVGGGKTGRGVVAAASYEARKFGVHSAMPGRRAAQICPDLIFVRGNLKHYSEVGHAVREIFHRYTPLVQPLSLDEAFLDVTGSQRLHGDAATIGLKIKDTIRRELRLTASVGVAPLKFVAKIASDLDKPNGFVEVAEDEVQEFLDPLPVARLWGVGKVGQAKLKRAGFETIFDIRRRPLKELVAHFGGWGEHLWSLSSGIDPRGVVTDRRAKQISHERTFAEDVNDTEVLTSVVSHLCEQVAGRLRHCDREAKTLTLKYRREDFKTFSRGHTLQQPTDSTDEIFRRTILLLQEMRSRQPRPVRLIGVSAGSLTERGAPRQLSLFDLEQNATANRQVDRVVDTLKDKIGSSAIHRGTSHNWVKGRKPKSPPDDSPAG